MRLLSLGHARQPHLPVAGLTGEDVRLPPKPASLGVQALDLGVEVGFELNVDVRTQVGQERTPIGDLSLEVFQAAAIEQLLQLGASHVGGLAGLELLFPVLHPLLELSECLVRVGNGYSRPTRCPEDALGGPLALAVSRSDSLLGCSPGHELPFERLPTRRATVLVCARTAGLAVGADEVLWAVDRVRCFVDSPRGERRAERFPGPADGLLELTGTGQPA